MSVGNRSEAHIAHFLFDGGCDPVIGLLFPVLLQKISCSTV